MTALSLARGDVSILAVHPHDDGTARLDIYQRDDLTATLATATLSPGERKALARELDPTDLRARIETEILRCRDRHEIKERHGEKGDCSCYEVASVLDDILARDAGCTCPLPSRSCHVPDCPLWAEANSYL